MPSPHLRTVLGTASPLAPYQPHPTERRVEGDLILLATGPSDARHHHAIVLGPVSPETLFTRARTFYSADRIDSVELAAPHPAAPTSHAALAAPVEDHLRSLAWQLAEEEPALVLDPLPDTLPAPPPDLTIRRATDQATLDHFYAISGPGHRHVPSVAAARDPNVAVLVGYVAGQPVATSRVSGHGDVADLMGVVTHPDFRRRGYGTALTWAAIAAARTMGARSALLTATPLGYPVYLKMGFTPICTMRTYEPPPADAPSAQT